MKTQLWCTRLVWVTFCVGIGDVTILFLQFHHCEEKQKYRKKIRTQIGMAEVSTTSWSVFAQMFIQNLGEYQMKLWSKLMVVTGMNSYNVSYFKTLQLCCLLEWNSCCRTSKVFHRKMSRRICIKVCSVEIWTQSFNEESCLHSCSCHSTSLSIFIRCCCPSYFLSFSWKLNWKLSCSSPTFTFFKS